MRSETQQQKQQHQQNPFALKFIERKLCAFLISFVYIFFWNAPRNEKSKQKKNCYSLTIKLQFFYETRVLFVLRKNMSACDFQGSKKRTGNYVRAAAEEASPAAAADRPKRKPKRARPCRDRDHRICKYAAHIVGMSGHIFLLLFIFFFCCFFCHTILIFRVLRSLHIARYRRTNNWIIFVREISEGWDAAH